MFKERKELPHCQYGDGIDRNGNEMTCDDPAWAVWNWGTGDFFVCERHDFIIQQQEEEKEE